ncbi:MAG: EamA family transporter RarD [Coriobacteriia bacterium]|nr:EamA family transporter RarD [Coriobacteriia bacterium]
MATGTSEGRAQTGERDAAAEQRRGVIAGALCYVVWGLLPLYWKLLSEVNPFEITCHRIIWCFAVMVLVCAVLRQDFVGLLRQRRTWKYLGPAALLITFNWTLYIYAVSIDCIVETALGYYINPLVSILLGVVAFRERLTPLQTAATALCAGGILFFTVSYGQFPWISVLLAVSFGAYGAVKKAAGYPATQALAVESSMLLVPAIAAAFVIAGATGSHAFLADTGSVHGWTITVLLVVAGAMTALPLVLFGKAATSIPLSLLGFLQYISPTIALLIGVFVNGEPFTLAHAVCFGCIWGGLALVGYESVRKPR